MPQSYIKLQCIPGGKIHGSLISIWINHVTLLCNYLLLPVAGPIIVLIYHPLSWLCPLASSRNAIVSTTFVSRIESILATDAKPKCTVQKLHSTFWL